MSKQTEKVLKQLDNYLKEKVKDKSLSEQEVKELTDEFIKEYNSNKDFYGDELIIKSDDYLEMAYEAKNREDAIKYAKTSLRYNCENLDAKSLLLDLTANDPLTLLKKQEKLIEESENKLLDEGYFKDAGHFWSILETRPYMRLRHRYIINLIENGMYGLAISECEILLDLCENDNLGVRYILMNLYAFMEEIEGCEYLNKEYPEVSASMLLPLSIVYFKIQDYTKAKKYLKLMNKHNKDLKRFLHDYLENDLKDENEMFGYYTPYSYSELLMCLDNNDFLYITCPYYFKWAYDIINEKPKKKLNQVKSLLKNSIIEFFCFIIDI